MRNWNIYHLTNSIINSCTKLQVLSNILSQQQQVVPPYQPSPQYVSCQFWIYSHIVWNQSNFCFFTLTGYSESTFLAQHCTAKAKDKARIHRRLWSNTWRLKSRMNLSTYSSQWGGSDNHQINTSYSTCLL
jgi:hypothetical protein